MARYSAQQLAEMTGGRLIGDPEASVEEVATPAEAGPRDLAFIRTEQAAAGAGGCEAGALITPVEVDAYAGAQIVCEDAEAAMAAVLEAFAADRFPRPEGVSERASIAPSARLGSDVAVGDYAVIGEEAEIDDGAVIYPLAYVGRRCRIGARTLIHAHVSIHDRVTIGADCVLHYGAVIGAEGFGFIQRGGRHVKLPQVGTVRIGDRVEIGALTTVDRAMLDETVIGDGTKIDNHCHVAHNCQVGSDCIMAGAAKLAGSVRLGRGVICAVDVGVADHLTVGDGAVLGARAGVAADVPAGQVVLGAPARPIAEQRRIFAQMARLPETAKRIRRLEKELAELRARLQDED